jgi:glycolate oxidase FAD binding subunit
VTVVGESADPASLQSALFDLGHAPLEIEAFDVAWADGGRVLARFGGVAPEGQAASARILLDKAGLDVTETDDDAAYWTDQRDAQRAPQGEVSVKLSALPADFEKVVAATQRLGGTLVGRAGLGLYWVRTPSTVALGEIRNQLGKIARHIVLLDAPDDVRAEGNVWGEPDPGTLQLMRAVKSRFDPAGICAPGLYVGGI